MAIRDKVESFVMNGTIPCKVIGRVTNVVGQWVVINGDYVVNQSDAKLV